MEMGKRLLFVFFCIQMNWISIARLIILMVLFMTSCRPEDDTRIRFGRLYLDSFPEQNLQDRKFHNVSYEKLFTIPTTTDVFLYNPVAVFFDNKGYIYVIDDGVRKALRFSPTGEYLTTYGEDGDGKGPGEIVGIGDFGVVGDSMVYILDNVSYKVVFYSVDGILLKEEPWDVPPRRYQQTIAGRQYVNYTYGPTVLESRLDGEVNSLFSRSDLVNGENVEMGGPDGFLITSSENLLWIFNRHPLLLQYRSDGTLVYARTTVDYRDDFKEPGVEKLAMGARQAFRPVGRLYHVRSGSIEQNELFIQSINPSGTKLLSAIDVYDVISGDYKYSLPLPEDGPYSTTVQNGKMYLVKDSTVVVWKIN